MIYSKAAINGSSYDYTRVSMMVKCDMDPLYHIFVHLIVLRLRLVSLFLGAGGHLTSSKLEPCICGKPTTKAPGVKPGMHMCNTSSKRLSEIHVHSYSPPLQFVYHLSFNDQNKG